MSYIYKFISLFLIFGNLYSIWKESYDLIYVLRLNYFRLGIKKINVWVNGRKGL